MKRNIEIAIAGRSLVKVTDYEIQPGKINLLFGESGIGKSIINRALFGLLNPAEFNILIDSKPYKSFLKSQQCKQIQEQGFFVFQEPSSHLNPMRTLQNQLREGSLATLSEHNEGEIMQHLWRGSNPQQVQQLLQVYPKPYRPSGGEKQRILLAMAFKKIERFIQSAFSSALFIFDEPSGSLDNFYRNLFLQKLLKKHSQKNFTALVITHDYSIISYLEQNYTNYNQHIVYNALVREEQQVSLQPFSKYAYLNWVEKQKPVHSQAINAGHELLRMKSGVRVHNRTLSFYNHTQNRTDLIISRGEITYLKAQSGVGKTTIAKVLMGLYKAEKMLFMFETHQISHKTNHTFWRKHIWGERATMVFQHADEALNQNATVLDTFKALSKSGKVNAPKVLRRIQELFDVTLRPDFLQKKIKDLSGGQKQRINILRSLVLDTPLLIMDEPLNGLDLKSAHKVIERIQQRQKAGTAILMISHNEEIFDKLVKKENIFNLKAE